MTEAAGTEAYVVTQKKEWLEIFSGFETANKYAVSDAAGNEVFYAAEVGTSWLARNFLKALRPWTIELLDADGAKVLDIARPFRFYFHKADVFDADGTMIGSIERRWSWLRRIYSVCDSQGGEVFRLFGPILHPWTFQLHRKGVEIGKIAKKWSGLATEAFTKADNFGVQFPSNLQKPLKSLVLAAVFLIDFVHFEKDNSR